VGKHFGAVAAVSRVDLEIARGETVALLGPNGAGKSTTISMLLGLVDPDQGSIAVLGESPRQAVRSGRIAAMLQDTGLMPSVSVSELVGLVRGFYPNPITTSMAIDLAGLTMVAGRRVDRLSGGQAQRLRFALVIVANPEILVLDEPTRALDIQGRAEFWLAMRGYAATGRTVLFATHYLDEVDDNAERVVVMARGAVIADGSPGELRARTGTSVVRLTIDAREPDLMTLAGVSSAVIRGDRATLRTTTPDDTVRALAASSFHWRNLEVTPPSLDDSFLSLTSTTASGVAAETSTRLPIAVEH
jgi:ABC-2 type transport system ATP-binding protein